MNKYNTIFIGTPDYSVPTLQTLIDDKRYFVSAVVTAPDAKVGRKQILTAPPVKVVAEQNNIPILQPDKIKQITKDIKKLSPDVIIVIAYGQIIPQDIIDMPQYGCLNLHASLLPKYRGAAPIQAAIANGDSETGVTLMKINKGLDTGDIIASEKIKITNADTGESLYNKLSNLSADVITKYLEAYLTGKLHPKAQNDSLATLSPKLKRDDGRIDWNKPAVTIERLVRAYDPWPGTFTTLDLPREIPDKIGDAKRISQGKKLKIIKVEVNKNKTNYRLGEIFQQEKNLAIQCNNSSLIIHQLQLEGKKPTSGAEFLNGNPKVVGQQTLIILDKHL